MNYHVYGIYIINYRFWYKTSLDFTRIAHQLVDDELMTISNPMIARLNFSYSIIKKKKRKEKRFSHSNSTENEWGKAILPKMS
jgi:hypothetical protein